MTIQPRLSVKVSNTTSGGGGGSGNCARPLSSSFFGATTTAAEKNILSLAESERSILACSTINKEHIDLMYSRQLCEDRKGVFDHLKFGKLGKSTTRVVIMQGAQIVTHYMNDQLKEEIMRDELVMKGKMSRHEADEEAEEWAEREWQRRWATYPHKLGVALAKYHAIILVMRFYEYVASKLVDKVTLDKFTMDIFESSKRSAKAGKEGRELGRDVFQTCWRANLISYLADYTVHQVILVFGYYVYIQQQRRLRRKDPSGGENEGNEGIHGGSVMLSVVKNSTLLAISRGVGLFLSSVGGAVGAMVISPGWGTLIGVNLGDGLAMAVSDEILSVNTHGEWL